MNHKQRVEAILEAFNFHDLAALDVWLEGGCSMWEGDIYDGDLIWDEGYRVKTQEDRDKAAALAAETRRRYESGEMQGYERLMYSTMRSYAQHMSDSLLSARPLLWKITNGEQE